MMAHHIPYQLKMYMGRPVSIFGEWTQMTNGLSGLNGHADFQAFQILQCQVPIQAVEGLLL